MFDQLLSRWLNWLGEAPCFQVYGKTKPESSWRTLDIFATKRRDADSRWPLWRGTCITWTGRVIVVGWDFAREIIKEQSAEPASRDHPVRVAGGRLNNLLRRADAGERDFPSASEVLAHECGHTSQALRLGAAYLPLAGAVTLFGEGPYLWNYFENQASEQGQFGGLVNGSVCQELMKLLRQAPCREDP
jgi:hypothetical protein